MIRFTGFLRPGQGFKPFIVLRRESGLTPKGRPSTGKLAPAGRIIGIISQASQTEKE